ncbi:MAG: NAD(P)-dependent alcohol dehydrogenase, partial [Hyphomicrobiales bacterium]|nr:NAD(P)-dependent alcohol dehydrogenase [Hyphomicrobiales bacterium]
AHAEFLSIAEDGVIVPLPINLGYDEAAAVPFGALSALVFLRDFAKVQRGQRVLVNGASGGVGVFAVQLAKYYGAEVTGVASAANQDLVRSLGADHVIDYGRADFAASGKTYDVIFDTVGTTSFARVRRALAPKGIYLPIEFGLREIGQSLVTSLTGGRKVVIGVSGDTREDLATIAELLEQSVIRSVIDDRFPLEQIAGAHRRVESRHKRGSVIVTVEPRAELGMAAE